MTKPARDWERDWELCQRVKELEDALRQCVEALELSSHKELCKMTVAPYDLIDYAKRVLEGERNDVPRLR